MSKRYVVLNFFVFILFTCLLLMLCNFNRLATDDYFFIWDVRHHGVITGVTSQYMEWCGRFAATFAMDVFYRLFELNHEYYFIFPFLSAVLISAAVFFLIKNLSVRLATEVPDRQRVILSISFTILLFFLSVDIGETWFWFCAQSSYMWSIIAFLWCCVFLTGRPTLISLLLAVLCIIYVGGSSEVYSAIFGLFFTIILVRNYRHSKKTSLFLRDNRSLLVVCIFFAISFLIFLVAPGNYLRDGLFPERDALGSFYITAKSIAKFGAFYLPFKLIYIFAFASPFFFAGAALQSNGIVLFRQSFKSFFYRASFAFAAASLLFFYLVAFVMVETGPPRIWFLLSFLFAIYCMLLFFCAGNKLAISDKGSVLLQYSSSITALVVLLFHLTWQYPIVSSYARAVDERIIELQVLKESMNGKGLVYLKPLPAPGMLYSTEITADTNHFTNRELRLGYELEFHVVAGQKK